MWYSLGILTLGSVGEQSLVSARFYYELDKHEYKVVTDKSRKVNASRFVPLDILDTFKAKFFMAATPLYFEGNNPMRGVELYRTARTVAYIGLMDDKWYIVLGVLLMDKNYGNNGVVQFPIVKTIEGGTYPNSMYTDGNLYIGTLCSLQIAAFMSLSRNFCSEVLGFIKYNLMENNNDRNCRLVSALEGVNFN